MNSSNTKFINMKYSKYYKKNTNIAICAYNIHNNNIFNIKKIFNEIGIIKKIIINNNKTIIYFKRLFINNKNNEIINTIKNNKNYNYKNIIINKYTRKNKKKVKKNNNKNKNKNNYNYNNDNQILNDLYVLSKNMAEYVLSEDNDS